MKAILISGSHNRHLFVHSAVAEIFDDILLIIMRREDENPQPPKGLVEKDRQNFIRHFNERSLAETRAFITKDSFEDKCNVRELIQSNQLNTPKVAELVEKFAADCCFIFGADLIRSPLFEALPKTKINLHLGLSPWYRGAATLFWPFYFLAPQYCGVTFITLMRNRLWQHRSPMLPDP